MSKKITVNKVKTDNYTSNNEAKSELNDISITTENNVFPGLKLLNKTQNLKDKNQISKKSDEILSPSKIENNSDQIKTNEISVPKFKFDEKKININEIIESSNALEPLSFRPSTRQVMEGLEKQILENISNQEVSTLTSSKHSKIESNQNHIVVSNKIVSNDENKNKHYNSNVEKNNIYEEEKQIFEEVDEKEIANFEGGENEEDDKNVFWNLRNNVVVASEHTNNQGLKRCKSTLDNQSIHSTLQAKSFNSSQIICVFSKIEKGNAIFVSSDDVIFHLPLNFLPKNAVPGNSYKITVEETEKIHKKITYLQNMQKRFLFLNFDENHK